MTEQQFSQLLKGDYGDLKTAIEREKPLDVVDGKTKTERTLNQLRVGGHDVFDPIKRPDKPQKDAAGNPKPPVKVARIGIPMQQLIVQRAASFLCANPIKLDCTPEGAVQEKMLAAIKRTWKDNKLDFKSLELAERMMGETEVAELWYAQADPETGAIRFRMMILSPSAGDTLYPVFDEFGDMIAFSRGYKRKEGDREIEHFDTYTAQKTYLATRLEEGWEVITQDTYIGKIPVVYHHQKDPEWADVQSMIDRLEVRFSRHADTNDYFGSPKLFVKGEISGIANKGEDGQIFESDRADADMKYLEWNFAPESVKMEVENLLSMIYGCTDTPNLSFESLKGLGNAPSGYAMMIVFMGAHLKAARKAGVFGEGIQRRLNYLKAAHGKTEGLKEAIDMEIEPQFNFFMPKDLEGIIAYLTTAVQGGIMAQETAVKQLGVVVDTDEEVKLIKKEKEDAARSQASLDQEFNQAA